MEPIDIASQAFDELLAAVRDYSDTILSEEDTRLKVISPILENVLGWSKSDIQTEEPAGTGYLDYRLSIDGRTRVVVEAKKDARDFGLALRAGGKAYKLNGTVFSGPNVKEGIMQAVAYCGHKNAELACVTNGREWVVFRGSRLGDGTDSLAGMAFVFPTLDSIREHFALFFELLAHGNVNDFLFRSHFQEAEGRIIRATSFRRTLHPPDTRHLLEHDALYADIDRMMSSFFRRISGDSDPDMLAQCFVVTRESQLADARLARISEDLITRVRKINTANADQLTELIKAVRETQRNQFVLLIGTKGAGKTTFIERFFRYVLPKQLQQECVIARVNLADNDGDETDLINWLDHHLLATLESTLFDEGSPSFDDLQGMFFDEYRRRSNGTLRHLYETDKTAFKIDFGRHIEQRREQRPHEYIQRLVQHVVKSRRKIPCLIFDNADHFTIEFQEKVFQYARSIYESEVCLVIMPITDRTSWQLSKEGALRSFESETLFLPTPSPKAVLRKRVEFLELKLGEEKHEPGKGYFFARGIPMALADLTAFTAALQAVFLDTGDVAWWIGNFANGDIRRCLEIAKDLVTSPHLEVHELVKGYIAESSLHVPLHKIKRAMIRGRYDIYPVGDHTFIRNIFDLDGETDSSPLIGVRILRLLRDAQKSDARDPFVSIEQVAEYFRAMLVEPSVTEAWVGKMLETGLCLSYDPTVTDVRAAGKVEISLAGFQHLRWATRDRDYVQAMLEITPIADMDVFEKLRELSRQRPRDVWSSKLETFLQYLVDQDGMFCRVRPHDAYLNQGRIAGDLMRMGQRTHATDSRHLTLEQ